MNNNIHVSDEQGYNFKDNIHHISLEEAQIMDAYKVIGEISPDALNYVKEGQEFSEDQVRNIGFYNPEKNGYMYQVKGPCGHFH